MNLDEALQRAEAWLTGHPCEDFCPEPRGNQHMCQDCGCGEAAHVIKALVRGVSSERPS